MQGKRLALYAGLTSIVAAVVIALAGQVSFSGVSFSYGSLSARGDLKGLGNTDVTVSIDAMGLAEVECVNPGGSRAPGQNVSYSGAGKLNVPASLTKNGRTPFAGVRASGPITDQGDPHYVAPPAGSCPNTNWTATYTGFVNWVEASLYVNDLSGTTLASQFYRCTTTVIRPYPYRKVSCVLS